MSATTGRSGSKFSGFTSEMKTMIVDNEQAKAEVKEEPVKTITPEPVKEIKQAKPKCEKKKIILSIPAENYEKAEIGAAMRFKGNITAYINSLIQKDIEENRAKYKEFEIITRG